MFEQKALNGEMFVSIISKNPESMKHLLACLSEGDKLTLCKRLVEEDPETFKEMINMADVVDSPSLKCINVIYTTQNQHKPSRSSSPSVFFK